MITTKKTIFSVAIASVLAIALLMTACARKEPSERIVAVINDYRMTVEDFNYESKEVLRTGIGIGDIAIAKEDILDALIIKEVLLQEAQKAGLDKDKNFMKTIELYWEQTLLRNLLAKKSREIEKAVTVYEGEITDYYNKMKEKIKAKVVVLANERTGRRLLTFDGDVAEYAEKEAEKSSLLYIIPSRVYILGDDNSPLENSIFKVERNKSRELIKINGKWALIIIEERIPVEAEPLSAARERITKLIKARKEREFMNEWIEALRSKARIRIDRKVLDKIH